MMEQCQIQQLLLDMRAEELQNAVITSGGEKPDCDIEILEFVTKGKSIERAKAKAKAKVKSACQGTL